MLKEARKDVGRYLTSEEAVELARIQKDNSVIGYALLTMDGDEIEYNKAHPVVRGLVISRPEYAEAVADVMRWS